MFFSAQAFPDSVCVVLVSSIPQQASVFFRRQTRSILKVSILQTRSLVWDICWPMERTWLFAVITFRLYIIHIDFFFFFWEGAGGVARVLLTLTRSYLCTHKFLNVHIWINEEVQVRLNDQTSVPGLVSWFSKAQLSSGSCGTGEYSSMHWGAGVHSVDKTNITGLSHVHTGCAELKNRR